MPTTDRLPMHCLIWSSMVIDNLNGIQIGKLAFFRTTDRKAPHNAYTDASHLQAGIDAMGYSQDIKKNIPDIIFLQKMVQRLYRMGSQPSLVKLDNFTDNHPWYEYDEETKEYKRFQFGKEHVDQLDNEPLTCDNIILQYSSCPAYDGNGYLNIDAFGRRGKFITRGKAIVSAGRGFSMGDHALLRRK